MKRVKFLICSATRFAPSLTMSAFFCAATGRTVRFAGRFLVCAAVAAGSNAVHKQMISNDFVKVILLSISMACWEGSGLKLSFLMFVVKLDATRQKPDCQGGLW